MDKTVQNMDKSMKWHFPFLNRKKTKKCIYSTVLSIVEFSACMHYSWINIESVAHVDINE